MKVRHRRGTLRSCAQSARQRLPTSRSSSSGGPTAITSAMKRFRDAGVEVMIGQMNEGALVTAITAHCVMALQPRYAELYGCYGLLDEVTPGISYQDGMIWTPAGPGLGTTFEASLCRLVWAEPVE